MTAADWVIVGIYIASVLLMSYIVGRSQKTNEDYYLAGRSVPPWQAGASMMSNQVSAISLVGAPAFIALREGGGLLWLQYELAIPLAMIVIILVLVPLLRSTGGITIYQYLEIRFGYTVRLIMSLIFLASRSLATGVSLLATSYVTSVCIGMPLAQTVIIIGAVSLIYTSMGGIKADIYSDIMQLIVLWVGSIVLIGLLASMTEVSTVFEQGNERFRIFDFTSTGIMDGQTFAFWPMLVGGLFLYISYYGCDQSQAQRLLTTGSGVGASKALMINGMLRFPLVLTYCCAGLLMIPFLHSHESFAATLNELPPDYLIPVFLRDYVPSGLRGLITAGIFAASMSSLDSAINSLSAATWEDVLVRVRPSFQGLGDGTRVLLARLITVVWGVFVIVSALWFARGADTVIEMVNKIGSAFYGPIAGVFFLGFMSRRAGQKAALTGLSAGVVLNLVLWIFFHNALSWMWWNCTGFFMTVSTGLLSALFLKQEKDNRGPEIPLVKEGEGIMMKKYSLILLAWFVVIVAACLIIEKMLG